MSKHTPGPWEVYRARPPQSVVDRKFEIVAPLDNGHLVIVGEHTGIDCLKEANARLIAAAPELLEALTNLVNDLDLRALKRYLRHTVVESARAAIAKATERVN